MHNFFAQNSFSFVANMTVVSYSRFSDVFFYSSHKNIFFLPSLHRSTKSNYIDTPYCSPSPNLKENVCIHSHKSLPAKHLWSLSDSYIFPAYRSIVFLPLQIKQLEKK